jgi:hypothetical protein
MRLLLTSAYRRNLAVCRLAQQGLRGVGGFGGRPLLWDLVFMRHRALGIMDEDGERWFEQYPRDYPDPDAFLDSDDDT